MLFLLCMFLQFSTVSRKVQCTVCEPQVLEEPGEDSNKYDIMAPTVVHPPNPDIVEISAAYDNSEVCSAFLLLVLMSSMHPLVRNSLHYLHSLVEIMEMYQSFSLVEY